MFSTTLLASLCALAAIPATFGATHEVTVGGTGILKFQPDSVNANVGDVVRFVFKQKNHTVTQSTLASPCALKDGGFDSGFVPVPDDQTDFPVAELEIHDTQPIWAYCKQGNHCAQGMVFAVNPGDKMDQFRSAALSSNGTQAGNATQSGSPYSPSSAAPSSASAPASAPSPVVSSSSVSSSTSTASSATQTSTSVDHRIIVGGPGKLLYDPSNITASVGDTVTFEFRQKSHSATQSSFVNPCVALASISNGQQGFDSGLMPVGDDVTGNFPTYTIKINDTNPVWGYCKQATHCMQGMVFSINANEQSSNTFAAFKSKAMSSSTNTTTSSTNNSPVGGASQPNIAVHARFSRNAGVALALGLGCLGALLL